MVKVLDCVVVGTGPAGLQAGYLLRKKGLEVRLLERGPAVSGFFRRFPRHRNFISINKRHTGLDSAEARLRYDWNSLLNDEGLSVTTYTGKYFPTGEIYTEYLEDFAAPMADAIVYDAEVTEIAKADGIFTVTCANGTSHQARHVVVACGVTKPWLPEVEGIELTENYADFSTDGTTYENKRMLILGKGNSAFETAEHLIEHTSAMHMMSPNPLRMAWDTHFVGHVRAVNNSFIDTYQLKSQNAVIDAAPIRIERKGDELVVTARMTAAEGHEIVLTYDHILCCTGFRFDTSIFAEDIRPELHFSQKFPMMSAQWESTSTENLWFAGTIMQSRDFKKTMSGFVHGFRHNIAAMTDFIACRTTGQPHPSARIDTDPAAVVDTVIDRISLSSGMFLQPGFLGDVIVTAGAQAGTHYRDVPVDWVNETPALLGEEALMVTLEFGNFGPRPTHVKRNHTAFGGEPDPFIHPVLRLYRDGALVATAHLSDHLDSDWRRPEDKEKGAGTVTRMTFHDLGETLPVAEIARHQIATFLAENGLGDLTYRIETAAE